MIGRDPNGIVLALNTLPRDCIVYAPAGSCTRFRRATRAKVVGQNVLGGIVLSVVVFVPGQRDTYVVPPAWIDPIGAPLPQDLPECVVIAFPGTFRERAP